jgi:transposase
MSRSIDLRERALACVSNGMPVSQVVKVFGVSRATLYRWKAQQKEGHVRPRPSPGGVRRIGPEQAGALLAQLQAHPDAYLVEHVRLWQQEQGRQVSLSTMRRALLRLNWTHKKRVCEP